VQHTCRFCDLEFRSGRSLGSHLLHCKCNPKYVEMLAKRNAKRVKQRNSYQFTCAKCHVSFVLKLTEKQFSLGKHAKHCSRSCANERQPSSETRAKQSLALLGRKYVTEFTIETCKVCDSVFQRRRNRKTNTCLKATCRKISRSIAAQGKTGGYRPRNTQTYNGQAFDSKWEVALAIRLDALKVTWERNTSRSLLYVDDVGRSRRYYPDFYLPLTDTYVEVKGYATLATEHKMCDAQARNNVKLIVLRSLQEIQQFTQP